MVVGQSGLGKSTLVSIFLSAAHIFPAILLVLLILLILLKVSLNLHEGVKLQICPFLLPRKLMIARIEIMHMGMSNYALAEELYADVPCQFGAGQNIAGKASTTTGMLNFWIKLLKSNTYWAGTYSFESPNYVFERCQRWKIIGLASGWSLFNSLWKGERRVEGVSRILWMTF